MKLITLGEARYRLGSKLDLLAGPNTVGPNGGTAVWTPSEFDNPSLQEVNLYLNIAFDWLYTFLASTDPLRYGKTFFLASNTASPFSLVGAPLPPDFAQLLRVDFMLGAGTAAIGGNPITNPLWMPVQSTSLSEEASYQWNVWLTVAGPAYRYIVEGQNIRFLPSQQVGGQFRIKYVPARQNLVADNDKFDGITGFEEIAITYAATQIAIKLQQFDKVQLWMQQMAEFKENMTRMAQDRDSGSAHGTIDLDSSVWPSFGFPRS